MLPEAWKNQIDEAINKQEECNEERNKASIERQNAIATPLDRLANEFVSYKKEQQKADEGKRRREVATIWGLIVTSGFTVILAISTIGLWLATRDLVNDAERTAERQLRAYVLMKTDGAIQVETFGTKNKDGHIVWDILPVAENTGITPAFQLVFFIWNKFIRKTDFEKRHPRETRL